MATDVHGFLERQGRQDDAKTAKKREQEWAFYVFPPICAHLWMSFCVICGFFLPRLNSYGG